MFRSPVAPHRFFLALVALLASIPALGQTTTTAATPAPELRVFDPTLIDKNIDPCDNFYQYSCSGWFKRNPLPPDQTEYGRFTELYELNRLHLKQILEDAAKPATTRTANEQKIGDEYASCVDTDAVNKLGIVPLQPELDRIGALKSSAELPALLARLHTIGVDAFSISTPNRILPTRARSSRFTGPAGWACPNATTTREPTTSPLSNANSMLLTCARFSYWRVSLMRGPRRTQTL